MKNSNKNNNSRVFYGWSTGKGKMTLDEAVEQCQFCKSTFIIGRRFCI